MLSYDDELIAAKVRTPAKRDATRLGLIHLVYDNLATSCSCSECAMATGTLRDVRVASGALRCRCGRQVLIIVSHAYSVRHKGKQSFKPFSVDLINIYALLLTSVCIEPLFRPFTQCSAMSAKHWACEEGAQICDQYFEFRVVRVALLQLLSLLPGLHPHAPTPTNTHCTEE